MSCNGDIIIEAIDEIELCNSLLWLLFTLSFTLPFFACFNLGLWRLPLSTTITFQLLLWSVERYVALMVFIEPCPTIHILAGVYVGSL